MTGLRKQAEDYAKDALKRYDGITMWKADVFRLVANAYERGYIEGDTKDERDGCAAYCTKESEQNAQKGANNE